MHKRLISLAVLAAAVCATSAQADIYSFTDEHGVVHFSNMPHTDKRFRLIYRDPTPATLQGNAPLRPASAVAPRPWVPSADDMKRYAAIIDNAAKSNQLDAALVHAVIKAESSYNPNAVSPKGAMGLMQLMPDTAKRFGVVNAFDPVENINAGTRYLRELLRLFNGNLELAIAGYNAGEGAVMKAGNAIPAFNETRAYVPKVLAYYKGFIRRA